MRKQITHIDCPEEFWITDAWGSHRPFLWLVLNKLKPDFAVECGIGYNSTLLIDSMCDKFLALETDPEWYDKFTYILKGVTMNTDSWESVRPIKADFLFVDCKPGESRKMIIEKCANTSKVIVAHDTEINANHVYGMEPVLSTFKYRLDFCPDGLPWTTAVSNFIDVTKCAE